MQSASRWPKRGRGPATPRWPRSVPIARALMDRLSTNCASSLTLTALPTSQQAGKAVLRAVPGYVLAPDMKSAKLFVTPPTTGKVTATAVASSDKACLVPGPFSASGIVLTVPTAAVGGKSSRCRATISITFSDESVVVAHYLVLPSLKTQVERVGTHWAEDAWLPRDFPDAFGRSASVMPYDRHDRARVLDDSRAYDVGLSDDAGGGNPLGFAIKAAYAPTQFQVTRLDDYVKWTLFGIKTDTAKPPFKSLQIRPEDCKYDPLNPTATPQKAGSEDGIRMTMYYYNDAGDPSNSTSGHFDYAYKGE